MEGYPTEEEEFELMYGDELQMLDEEPITNPVLLSQQPGPVKSITNANITNKTSFLQSPQLSQIPHNSKTASVVNRQLFEERISSTPINKVNPVQPIVTNPIPILGTIRTKKRRLEDIFGDIADINDDISEIEFEHYSKKVKSEEERDLEIIEKILEARKKFQDQLNPLQKSEITKLEALHHYKMQNLSYSVPRWPFAVILRSDGERIYVRFHSEEFEDERISEINMKANSDRDGLFGSDKEQLWNAAREIILKRTAIKTSVPSQNNNISIENLEEENLWVEKYRPKRYIDLLSGESTNRTLLQWMKMWDKVVFGREPKKVLIENHGTLNTFNKKTGKFEINGGWKRKSKLALNLEYDNIGRPMQKIALLCGPPGLGKTTLAHTIARHAGYDVRELNASDDRNPESFRLALENGTQMRSVLNKDNRPNCIVLDEIDGAPQKSIDFLIRFIQDSVVEKGGKKGNEKKYLIKRPVICICNDLYVPALRQLRQIALIVNFPEIESVRLADRLQSIAYNESIKTDMTTLLSLSEKTGNDIRSCISILQFYNGLKKPLTLLDVLRSNVGQKDKQKSLFSVWGSVFQICRPKKTLLEMELGNPTEVQHVTMSDMSATTRMKTMLDVIHRGGDYERLMQGVFENYLTQKMPDPNLNGVVEATEWFIFSDRIQRVINERQNYTVYPYLQYGFVVWHFLFAGLAWPKINFPTKGFEATQKATTVKMILTGLRKLLNPNCFGVGEGSTLLLDSIPLIKHIVCPSLRSVSLQLLTEKEKTDLRRAVEIMADLGVGYIQLKASDGTYQYQLEPDLNFISNFTDISTSKLTYWSKQLIAREVELEVVRRAAPKQMTKVSLETTPKINQNKSKKKSPSNLPNHLRTLKPKTVQPVKETVTRDFFGRIIVKPAITLSQEAANVDVIVKSPIWYRYKEGYNNAVRKDLTISDLL